MIGTAHPIEMFMLPNVLKAKVGGFGGLDMAAIRRAEQAVAALKSEFRAWAAQDLARLVAARDRYRKSRSGEARDGVLRAAHELRGQASSFDFPLIARLAASLHRLLGETPPHADLPPGLLDAHVDAAQVIFRENIDDEKNEIACILYNELNARVTAALGGRSRTSSPKAN